MKLSVIVPAYQAASTLSRVVERIPSDLWPDIDHFLVIDDGSSDATSEIVRGLAKRHPQIELLAHPRNLGYGATVRDGLLAARNWNSHATVCLHADGQYPPERIPWLLGQMDQRGLDLLQGSRHLDGGARKGGMPLYKIVAGKLLVALENAVFGLELTDYHSGFLFYSRKAIDLVPFDKLGASFDFDLQVIACCRAMALSIGEESIPTRYADEVSHLRSIPYGLRVLNVLWRYRRSEFHRVCRRAEGPSV